MKRKYAIALGVLFFLVALVTTVALIGYPHFQRMMKNDMTNLMVVEDCKRVAMIYNAEPVSDRAWEADLIEHCRFLGNGEERRYTIFLLPPSMITKETDVVGCTDHLGSAKPGFVVLHMLGGKVQPTFQESIRSNHQMIADLKKQGAKEFTGLKQQRPMPE